MNSPIGAEMIWVAKQSEEFEKARWAEIEAIIASGKVVRFHYGDRFYKDVNDLTKHNENNGGWDLESFRRTGGQVPYVAWYMPELEIEAVDP